MGVLLILFIHISQRFRHLADLSPGERELILVKYVTSVVQIKGLNQATESRSDPNFDCIGSMILGTCNEDKG